MRQNYGFGQQKVLEAKQEKEEKHQKGRKAKVTRVKTCYCSFGRGRKSEKPLKSKDDLDVVS